MAGWTRAIVRLDGPNRMVTKGYRKGVYKWVTKGIWDRPDGGARARDYRRFVAYLTASLVSETGFYPACFLFSFS